MSHPLEKLREFLDSPEGAESIKRFHQEIEDAENRKKRNAMRIIHHIKDLSDAELHEAFLRFFEWEEKYEEMFYKRGILTQSNVMTAIQSAWEMVGDTDLEFDEDFFSGGAAFRGYIFKTYCGQGCFTRIVYKDETIFQTS
jgi:hypothetical protein